MNIEQYQVVSAELTSDLQAQVQLLIAQGWQPLGSTFVSQPQQQWPPRPGAATNLFMQTMVKYSK